MMQLLSFGFENVHRLNITLLSKNKTKICETIHLTIIIGITSIYFSVYCEGLIFFSTV